MNQRQETVVSVLTPPGRGAVAVIAVEGPAALELVDRFFHAKSGRLAERATNRIAYGRWGAEPAEEVIACRHGPESVEVHCHGGVAAVKRIVGDLTERGAAQQPWQEHVARHEPSPSRAAARIALSKAVTQRTSLILLDQFHGALDRAVAKIIEHLSGNQLDPAKKFLEALLVRAAVGLHLTQPWQVVIAGPPNVGKSSLINALLGYERAIVFDQPGTTRDVVTAHTALDGWPVQLADTAGLRASDDELESAGVQRAIAQAAAADCLILLFDASQPRKRDNDRLIQNWPQALVVHNKCDLGAPAVPGLAVSALVGTGIDRLIQAIVTRLVPFAPQPEDAVPFTAAQVEPLETALHRVERGDAISATATLNGFVAPTTERSIGVI